MRVEQTRGDTVEVWHDVHVAVVDRAGRLVAGAGDPELVTFWRSAAKPVQALPLVEGGAADRFGFTSEELALACASHSSEPDQVARVRALLAKIGCAEEDLLCGPHPPLSERVARDYAARGVTLTAVYSNCSGKHAAMLALARHHGWPTAGYTARQHPVQQRCLAAVSEWTDVAPDALKTAVDGCGVVCFGLPLRRMALAYVRLGDGAAAGPASGAPARIVAAMLAHPDLIAGAGRPCTELARAYPGRVIAKVGAEGVYCALLVRERLGVALKVSDGQGAAAVLALGAVLAELGLGAPPAALAPRPLLNTRGEPVGALRVAGTLVRYAGATGGSRSASRGGAR